MKTRNQNKTTMALVAVAMAGILSANAALLVYEPFAYPDGSLTGQGGALGTAGTWASYESLHPADGWRVHQEGDTAGIVVNPAPALARNMFDGTVTNLPTSGGYVGLPGPLDLNPPADPDTDFEIGRYMDASIALDPGVTATFQSGTTTWFSYVAVHGWDRNQETPNLTIGTDPTVLGNRAYSMQNAGNGISAGGGPPRNNRPHILPRYFSGGASYNLLGTPLSWQDDSKTAPLDTAAMTWVASDADGFGAANIIVGKIQWDADVGGEDIVTVVGFLETDTLSEEAFGALVALKPALSSANWTANKPNLDQSQFDTLNIAGTKFFVDEIRIATTFAEVIGGSGSAGFHLNIARAADGGHSLEWASRASKLYDVKSSPDVAADLSTWSLVQGNILATPPTNTLTISPSAEPQRFFVVEERPRPTAISDDFESGIGGWTTGSENFPGTAWELGTPQNVGPSAAHSPTKCFGSNIAGNYDVDADIWLRSPAIDLTAVTGATLEFWHFTATWDGGTDFGTVKLLDASDNSVLAVIAAVVEGTTPGWVQFTRELPAEAYGKQIKIEFRFQSVFSGMPGWYIDDVKVFTP